MRSKRSAHRTVQPVRRSFKHLIPILGAALLLGLLLLLLYQPERPPGPTGSRPGSSVRSLPPQPSSSQLTRIENIYPADQTFFPLELPPPRVHWHDPTFGVDGWQLILTFPDSTPPVQLLLREPAWRPEPQLWERVLATPPTGAASDFRLTIAGFSHQAPDGLRSRGQTTFSISRDRVTGSIFYREVPLPFREANRVMERIRWRLGRIADAQPRVVLERLPVCGNCHSFSRDGRVLGMDVDYANDKGAYMVTEVQPEVVLEPERIISWNDYQQKDGEQTYGLLSQVSPDGRYVVSTVKDRSLFVPVDDIWFSQLFYPVKGILAIYDRQQRRFFPLPGADDPRFVQSNPSWAPDGQSLIFARAPVQQAVLARLRGNTAAVQLQQEDFHRPEYHIQYSLYRIPFHGGVGGVAQPIPGAADNGRSNYFARTSPDGRWIVFCQARTSMLLQPDSELFILPATGGTPRRMRCNGQQMNSWHSFSPDGRWLVFASKRGSPYTQLYLTHLDANGQDSPAVLLEHFTEPEQAANIPEFVALQPEGLRRLLPQYLDDHSHVRLGSQQLLQYQDRDRAQHEFEQALRLNPHNVNAQIELGGLALERRQFDRAEQLWRAALTEAPTAKQAAKAHQGLAMLYLQRQQGDRAEQELRLALQAEPDLARSHFHLGELLLELGRPAEAIRHLRDGLAREPDQPEETRQLAAALLQVGDRETACQLLRDLLSRTPTDQETRRLLQQCPGP